MASYNVVFDIGNVLCKVDFVHVEAIRASDGIWPNVVNNIVYDKQFQSLHDIGATNITNCIKCSQYGSLYFRDGKLDGDILDAWSTVIQPVQQMIDFAEKCIDDGREIALCSNVGVEHVSIMRGKLGDKIMDNAVKFFSCEAGVRKPTYAYYDLFLRMYPQFTGATYFDDIKENINAGNKFGLNGHLFDIRSSDAEEAASILKKMLY
jgi:FMN phosphatase YigB (HAD superfamily)